MGQEIPWKMALPEPWPTDRFVAILKGVLARPLFVCALALTLASCEGYVRRGSTLYADGRYIEAAEVFERTEDRLPVSTPREKAEYGLYRGMTLLVLGDLENARRWLGYAYEIERAQPGTLRHDRRVLLDRGWFQLDHRQQRGTPTTEGPERAVATTGPTPEPTPVRETPPPGTTNERALVPH
jgi:tetratricopeptide (TPR) repeat protein